MIGPMSIEPVSAVTAKDLQDGWTVLQQFTHKGRSGCLPGTGPPPILASCLPLPPVVGKTAPHYSSSEEILFSNPPYVPYKLTRIQNQLDFAVLVPVEQIVDGYKVFQEWSRRADKGMLFNCLPADNVRDGPVIFPRDNEALASSLGGLQPVAWTTQGETHDGALSCLAILNSAGSKDLKFASLCQIFVIDRVPGAPMGCILLEASSDSHKWLLAHVGSFVAVIGDLGRPDFSFNIFYVRGSPAVVLDAPKSMAKELILKAAETALHSPPLALTTKLGRYLLGVSPQRESPVLGDPWNEEVTVRIDVTNSIEKDITEFTLEVSTSILVNGHKDANLKSWHKPSEQQTRSWTDAVRKRLNEELIHLCPQYSRRDDFTLICNGS